MQPHQYLSYLDVVTLYLQVSFLTLLVVEVDKQVALVEVPV